MSCLRNRRVKRMSSYSLIRIHSGISISLIKCLRSSEIFKISPKPRWMVCIGCCEKRICLDRQTRRSAQALRRNTILDLL
jgi:hypothetical protein